MTTATSGPALPEPSAYFDPEACCWRTSQLTLGWDSTPSSPILPRWGTTRAGALYELPTPVPLTVESACSSLLPTPAAQEPGGTVEQYHERLRQADGRTSTFTPLSMLASTLLPTPMASLGRGTGMPSTETAHLRQVVQQKRNLDDAIALLPTPVATAGTKGSSQRGLNAQGGPSLAEEVRVLLPTPDTTHDQAEYGNGYPTLVGVVVPSAKRRRQDQRGGSTSPPSAGGSECSDGQPLDLLSLLALGSG